MGELDDTKEVMLEHLISHTISLKLSNSPETSIIIMFQNLYKYNSELHRALCFLSF